MHLLAVMEWWNRDAVETRAVMEWRDRPVIGPEGWSLLLTIRKQWIHLKLGDFSPGSVGGSTYTQRQVLDLSTMMNKMAISKFDLTILRKRCGGGGLVGLQFLQSLKKSAKLLFSLRLDSFQYSITIGWKPLPQEKTRIQDIFSGKNTLNLMVWFSLRSLDF